MVGGSCEALTTDIKDQALVPFTGSLSCKGNGSQFEIQLYKDNVLQKSWKQQGGSGLTVAHYFNEAGNYRSICYVDGVSHPVCSDPTAVSFTTQSLTDTLVSYQQQKPQSSALNTSSSVTVSSTIDPKAQHISLDSLVQAQQQDAIDVFMKQKLAQLQSTDIVLAPITTPIITHGIDFHKYIDQQTKQFHATQQSQCQDLCQLSFILKAPVNTGYCGDAVVQKPNGSGFIELCDDGNQLTGDECLPNCTLPVIVGSGYCGDTIKQTPNSS
jgi:cysteine-rich repeat protein